jgi:hypothetical protein
MSSSSERDAVERYSLTSQVSNITKPIKSVRVHHITATINMKLTNSMWQKPKTVFINQCIKPLDWYITSTQFGIWCNFNYYVTIFSKIPVLYCRFNNVHVQWRLWTILLQWSLINFYSSASKQFFWGMKSMKICKMWLSYLYTSFIGTIFLETKVSGWTRLHCISMKYVIMVLCVLWLARAI